MLVGFDPADREAELHPHHATDRLSGEWFRPSHALAETIARLTPSTATRRAPRLAPMDRSRLTADIGAGDWIDVPPEPDLDWVDAFDWADERRRLHERLFGRDAFGCDKEHRSGDEPCQCEDCSLVEAASDPSLVVAVGICSRGGHHGPTVALPWPDDVQSRDDVRPFLRSAAWRPVIAEISPTAVVLVGGDQQLVRWEEPARPT